MKKNFICSKNDFDNYLKSNLIGRHKPCPPDSVTTKKSDVEELLKDTNEHNSTKDLMFLDEQNFTLKENQE